MSDSIITSEPNRITVTTGSLVTQYSDHPLSAAKQITLLHTQIKQLTERLAAAEAERDKLRKRSTERRVQVTDLYGNLSLENDRLCTKLAAVEDDVMEIAKVLYFGFMICESQCGRAEVRIKFADLKYAQRLHSILVKIQNKRDIHDEAAKGGRDE